MSSGTATIVAAVIGVVATITAVFLTRYLESRRHSDKELFYFWRMAFDRSVFKGAYILHSDHQAFKDALDATIKAINTGVLFDRDGNELGHVKGKSYIRNPHHRQLLNNVVDALEQVRSLLPIDGPPSQHAATGIDTLRDKAIEILNEVFTKLKIPPLPLPTETKHYDDLYKSFAEG